jgi:hypothetical protein
MKSLRLASLLLLFTAPILLTSCYTKFASEGDYYGYSGKTPERTKTETKVVERKTETAQVVADTTIHGDTVFIDEHPKATASNSSTNDGQTVINNYYYNDYDYDYLPSWWNWHPRHHQTEIYISFGWPHYYHSWYSPWYSYYPSWDYPYYDRWAWHGGYYPPVYDCYSPYYGYYAYDPYYDPYYYPRYRYNQPVYNPPHNGRVGGERRASAPSMTLGHQPSGIVPAGLGNIAMVGTRNGIRATAPGTTTAVADRNAPVHAVAPGDASSMSNSRATIDLNSNRSAAPADISGQPVRVESNSTAATPSRSTAPSTGTTSTAATPQRRVVVIHRAPASDAGAANSTSDNSTGRSWSNGSNSSSNTESSRGSSTPSRRSNENSGWRSAAPSESTTRSTESTQSRSSESTGHSSGRASAPEARSSSNNSSSGSSWSGGSSRSSESSSARSGESTSRSSGESSNRSSGESRSRGR